MLNYGNSIVKFIGITGNLIAASFPLVPVAPKTEEYELSTFDITSGTT